MKLRTLFRRVAAPLACVFLVCAAEARADEAAFVMAAQKYVKPYRDAKNELQKSTLRRKRVEELKTSLNGQLAVEGWTGVLTDLSTTSDGDAYIAVEIAKDITVKTWNNALSDSMDKTIIKFGTPLFNALAEMEEGTRVRFSGSFFSGQDFVKEVSLTENGSMSEPEFLFRFSQVTKR